MRPKRPKRPTPPPPPIPAVVTPENLDAINLPEVDKLPAYISPGKFQWKPPLPGPKGDQGQAGTPGAPGEPGATARPIVPPVVAAEIAADAVETATIKDLNVTNPKVADDTLMPVKLSKSAGFTAEQALVVDTATGKFKSVAIPAPGVSAHTALTDKEVGGVIDHADGSVTPAKLSFTPGNALLKVGSYNGNGAASQAITGIGFQPKVVMIYVREGVSTSVITGPYIKTNQDGANALFPVYGVSDQVFDFNTNQILSLDGDGFTVGNPLGLNWNGKAYTYVALG